MQDAGLPSVAPARRSRRLRRLGIGLGVAVAAWALVAYVALPAWWSRQARLHPRMEGIPGITYAADGIPGDPLNVALVGSRHEVMGLLLAARWHAADPLTFDSCLEIAAATVLRRPYVDAPVSSLYLEGRKQDLAFEQPVGDDPRERHHVRFWRWREDAPDGRPLWVGSATFDRRVGLSGTTGQITHHIAADVDSERDHLFANLEGTGRLAETVVVRDFHPVREGRNGGGDPWHTDGCLDLGIVAPRAP